MRITTAIALGDAPHLTNVLWPSQPHVYVLEQCCADGLMACFHRDGTVGFEHSIGRHSLRPPML